MPERLMGAKEVCGYKGRGAGCRATRSQDAQAPARASATRFLNRVLGTGTQNRGSAVSSRTQEANRHG